MQDFRKLRVWRRSHELVLDVHRETLGFPADERFGLTSQLRRAASSIPTNIAEGCGRGGNGELGRFLQIAKGSAAETDYLLELARDLGHLSPERHEELAAHVREIIAMLLALHARVRPEAAGTTHLAGEEPALYGEQTELTGGKPASMRENPLSEDDEGLVKLEPSTLNTQP